ncbi:MAG: glycine cleavage system protein T [Nitrospirae bacterium GWD2_57_9]|nr:MAG: glycine cleavage system protein T [Nitrospirae bacterium GWD2_57_9]OGW45564.1 MAG: glycine cleavage system protein T [Nitrospirae bacterium GWC2_57_9]
MKQTVLHHQHLQAKARMTEFQGWHVPQVFTDVQDEYHAVRTTAGLFDVGFLGRIEISGQDSASLLQKLFTRDIGRISERSAHYGMICNESGFVLDDEMLFRLSDGRSSPRFLLSTNAINTAKVLNWLRSFASAGIDISDATTALAQFSLQGPQSPHILEKVLGPGIKKFKPRAVREVDVQGRRLVVCRTGYTGEHGYEFFVSSAEAEQLWKDIMQAGGVYGLMACGLASRDILRLEMGYLLYGNDLDESRTPLEAGLERFVDLKKDFLGRDRLLALKAAGTEQRLAGFMLLEKTAPRPGGSIFSENREIGAVTSGCLSPALRVGIGLGYVVNRYAQPGQEIEVEIRDREYVARIVDLPFYKRK